MNVEVILTEPVMIDGKTIIPDGQPMQVSEEIAGQLIEAGAAMSAAEVVALAAHLDAGDPAPEAKMQEVIDAAVSAATTLLQGDKASLEARLVDANRHADQLTAEMKTAKAYVRELERELLDTKDLLAERDAEITSLKAQNTSAAKTTPKKGAAAETA